MKKVFIILLVCIILCLTLTACNRKLVGNYKFTRIHIYYEGYEECLEIKSWTDSEVGIEVETVKYGTLFISEGHYLLCEHECPICKNRPENGGC